MKGCERLLRSLAALTVLSIGLIQGTAAAGKVTLDNIDFTALPGNEFENKLGFSGEPPEPLAYTIDKPARIVLDLPGVQSALKEKKHPMAFENAQSAVVLTSGGIGSTPDDLTMAAVAATLGRPLVVNREIDDRITRALEWTAAQGVTVSDEHEQASGRHTPTDGVYPLKRLVHSTDYRPCMPER